MLLEMLLGGMEMNRKPFNSDDFIIGALAGVILLRLYQLFSDSLYPFTVALLAILGTGIIYLLLDKWT